METNNFMDKIITFGPGQGIKKYKDMNEEYIKKMSNAKKSGNIRCSICGTRLIIAAFGPHIDDGGSFKRHSFLRAKNKHTPGFSCFENTSGKTQIPIDTTKDKESLANAAQRLFNEKFGSNKDGTSTKHENVPNAKRKNIGNTTNATSRKIKNVSPLPDEFNKVRSNKKYSYVAKMTVQVNGYSESGHRIVYLRSTGKQKWFSLKLKSHMNLYEEIVANVDQYNKKKINVASAFILKNISRERK